MSNPNGWGDGSVNNNIGWGQGANNSTGWGKSQLSSWSGATDIDGGDLPTNSIAPAITGTAQEGQTLTCSTGTWSGSPTYAYQWKRNGNNIGGATSSTYTLVTADVGQSILCTVTATNFVGSATANSNTVTPTSSVDADAQAFITAASITDPTQQSAINTLVTDLKGYGIWTKLRACYPFVGGTAAQHKWNLKDPRDLDAAFRLTYGGAPTHNSNGITFNAFNTFANTHLIGSSSLSQNNNHFSYYNANALMSGNEYMGAGPPNWSILGIGGGNVRWEYWPNTAAFLVDSTASIITSFVIGTRTAANANRLFVNGVSKQTSGDSSSALPSVKFYLGAVNNNGTSSFHTRANLRFASFGDGLTTTEAANFYTAVQTFQTALNRNV